MLRKRIIFALIYSDGFFMQSRNFRLQKVTKVEFQEASRKINPQLIVNTIFHYPPFSNWFEYLTFKNEKIKSIIQEILLINDNIDSEVLELLIFVEDETSRFIFERKKFANKDLEYLANSFYSISKEIIKLTQVFKKNYSRYEYEYNYNARKKNLANRNE